MGLYLTRHEKNGSTVTVLGTIRSYEVNNMGVDFFANKRFEEMGYSIWDLNEADFPDFQPGQNPEIQNAVMRAAQTNPSHRIGFVASNPMVKNLCEVMIETNAAKSLPWNLRVFSSIDQALDWVDRVA